MSKNVTVAGASYTAVPSVNLPATGGGTASFFDVSGTTATASDVATGKLFYAADGTLTTGTASGGGGGSSFNLIHEEDLGAVSYSSTSAASLTTITGISGLYTDHAIILITIRDKNGPRNGYFYGSDAFIVNKYAANGRTTDLTLFYKTFYVLNSSGRWGDTANYQSQNTSGNGIYVYMISNSGELRIYQRYNASYSGTIDGDFTLKVYTLDWPESSPFLA